jgi:hypothetical protein
MALLTQIFHGAQTFYVDPAVANNARTVDIAAIDLYFKHKPDFNLNLTGQQSPSVTLFIAETIYGVPKISRDSGIFTNQFAVKFNEDIFTSTDATQPTEFRFETPQTVETGKEYAIVWVYNNLAEYIPWTSKIGEVLTNSTAISPGPSNQFIGKFYDFTSVFVADSEETSNLDEYLSNWRTVSDTSLKFSVKIAKYSDSLYPVTSNASYDVADIHGSNPLATTVANTSGGIGFNVNFGSYEFISFNENRSNKAQFVGGLLAYANTFFYPGGYENAGEYVSVTTQEGNNVIVANTEFPNGTIFQWSNIFPTQYEHSIVITDEIKTNVRSMFSIISNTELQLSEAITFSNNNAKFMITPIGQIGSFDKKSPFGIDSAFVMLHRSGCNSTVRFVNNRIESTAITAGGTGYSNDDVLYVTGFEDVSNKVTGGYIAVANMVTNSTGGIDSVYFSNLGCGFVNTATIVTVIANSTSLSNTTANTSAGSGGAFSYTIGSTIKTDYGNNVFRECVVENLDIGEFIPFTQVDVPAGTDYTFKLETNYVKKSDNSTYSGFAYFVNPVAANNQLQLTLYETNSAESLSTTPVIPSKSNEYGLFYEDTSPNDKISSEASSNSQSLRLVSNLTTNSDFSTIRVGRPVIRFSKWIINNDATNEHTDSGNAYAKHLTKTINFARTAEDIRVYLTGYKPANTDFKVYARIYKNEDPEAFDDKHWTLLELKDGIDVVSSSADDFDYKEYTYGFYQVPPNRTELSGIVEVQSANTTLLGSETLWDSELAVGDLVYCYQPLFIENHFIASVTSISSNTECVVDFSTSNVSIIAEGMKIEKMNSTDTMQGFNNKQNDNVVRYYNSTSSKYDGYETVAVKIVFLSDSPHKIPRVDDLRITGVSA